MRDFTSNIDDDSIMNARADRNRPDVDPGMGDDDDGWESIGSSDSGWGDSFGNNGGGRDSFGDDDFSFGRQGMGGGFGGNDFGGGFGNNGFGNNGFGNNGNRFGNNSGFSSQYGNPNQMQQQQQQMMNPEDRFWGAVATGGKEGLNFITAFFKSFKNFNVVKRKDFGRNLFISGGVLAIVSIILMIVLDSYFLHFLIASVFSLGLGSIVFMSSMDKLSKEGVPMTQEEEPTDFETSWEEEPIETEEPEEPQFSDEILGRLDDEPEFDNPLDIEDDIGDISLSVKTKEEMIQELEDNMNSHMVDPRMMNKQYLYDMMLSTLITKTPHYARETVLEEDSREFLAFYDMIKKAAEVLAPSNHRDEYPELIEVRDKLFYTSLIVTRPKWLKDKQISSLVKEIVNVCAFDKKTMQVDESVTGTGTYSGGRIYIKINKGDTAMVTLKDIYLSDSVRNEITTGKMKMPLVFGIDAEGEALVRDFKDVHALLVSGAPRSGKTWFVKTLLAQLMMFKKPSEFEFYIIDAKTLTSDYYHLVTPHIRDFLTTDEEIITLLRHLCYEEAARREQQFLEKGGVQNIEDFHKKNPFEKMPYILVVMDEVITISNRMDKEMKNEFMSLLKMFTSRLPGLGIRILMVPHVVKNEVLSKTITDMIPYRISVKGDAEHIEGVTGATPKQFPMKLNHMGDIAFKLDNSGVLFAHTPIISDTNQGFDEFFEYLTDFWLHIEPESFKGSKLEKEALKGLRNVDSMPSVSDEYKEEIRNKRAELSAARSASRPQRPPSKPASKPTVNNLNKSDSSENVVSRIGPVNRRDGTVLNEGETHELLKDAHSDLKPKSNITSDDILK